MHNRFLLLRSIKSKYFLEKGKRMHAENFQIQESYKSAIENYPWEEYHAADPIQVSDSLAKKINEIAGSVFKKIRSYQQYRAHLLSCSHEAIDERLIAYQIVQDRDLAERILSFNGLSHSLMKKLYINVQTRLEYNSQDLRILCLLFGAKHIEELSDNILSDYFRKTEQISLPNSENLQKLQAISRELKSLELKERHTEALNALYQKISQFEEQLYCRPFEMHLQLTFG